MAKSAKKTATKKSATKESAVAVVRCSKNIPVRRRFKKGAATKEQLKKQLTEERKLQQRRL